MGFLASMAGGGIGLLASQGDQSSAEAAKLAALQGILGVQAPNIAEQQVNPNLEAVQGTYNPNAEGTMQQGPSAMQGISIDPRLVQAQMNALGSLQQQGQGGLTATDRMNLMNINNQASGNAQAASQAIMQNMQARGMGGGGQELAARMMAAQGAANQGAQQGMGVAAQSQQKALQSLAGAGSLGSQMQAQSFGQQAQQAQAADAINRFNAANRQQVLGTNTQAQNQAQVYNLGQAQQVANANAALQNQAQYYNKGLYQQQYNNQMGQAKAAAGQQNSNSDYYAGQAAATRGMWSGMGDAAGQYMNKSGGSSAGGDDLSGNLGMGNQAGGGGDGLGSLIGNGFSVG